MPGRRRFLRLLAGGAGAGVVAMGTPAPVAAQAPGGVAVPDLGGDARSALQRSLDEVGALGGGTVVVPPGEHRIDGELLVPSNVTLAGRSRTAARLVGALIRHPPGVEGATVEDLTLEGGVTGVLFEADGPDAEGAAFCIVRRLRISGVAGTGIRLLGGTYRNVYVEQVWIDGPGRHGIDLAADGPCRSVFLSEVSVERPGSDGAPDGHGLRLAGRCQVTQVQVAGIGPGAVGIGFLAGSDHTTVTNLALSTEGGVALSGQDQLPGVVVGPHEVEVR